MWSSADMMLRRMPVGFSGVLVVRRPASSSVAVSSFRSSSSARHQQGFRHGNVHDTHHAPRWTHKADRSPAGPPSGGKAVQLPRLQQSSVMTLRLDPCRAQEEDGLQQRRRGHPHYQPRRNLGTSSRAENSSATAAASDTATPTKTALVMGSSGALGSAVSRHLSSMGIAVLGADVAELPPDLALDGFELDGFVPLPRDAGLTELATDLVAGVDQFLASTSTATSDRGRRRRRLDAIVCASGGWQMDPTFTREMDDASELSKNVREYAESVQRMIRMNLDPVVASAFLAQHCMNADGLLVVLGASAALQPTPGMMAYGVSKCASHHVVRTLGASTGRSLESKALRRAGAQARQALPAMDSLTCVGILPTMMDTPANRKANPQADTAQWAKPRDIAKEVGNWISEPELRPHSGSLLKVHRAPDGTPLFELVR